MDRPNAEATGASALDAEAAAAAAANKRLRIVTRCATLPEFFGTFGAFADESSLFIVTNKPRSLGLKQPFVIQLKDGETIMRGDVEVIASITDGNGPGGRNGMRLKLLHADEATRDVHRRLLAHAKEHELEVPVSARDALPPSVGVASEARPAPSSARTLTSAVPTSPGKGDAPEKGGIPGKGEAAGKPAAPGKPPVPGKGDGPGKGERASAPTSLASRPMVGERAPGSSYQLPANPFESVTAEALESFVECTLYEERVPRVSDPDFAFEEEAPASRSGAGLGNSTSVGGAGGATSVVSSTSVAGATAVGGLGGATSVGGVSTSVGGFGAPSGPGGATSVGGFGGSTSVAAGSTSVAAGLPIPPLHPADIVPPAPPRFSAPPLIPPPRPSAPTRDTVLLAAAIQAASVPTTGPKRRLWLIGLVAVVSSVASLGAAYMFWGKSDSGSTGPTTAATSATPSGTPAPDRTGAPLASSTVAAAALSNAPSAVPSSPPLPRECKANVRSYPQGAAVTWNQEALGTTPLADVAVPCGPAKVQFDVRGYVHGERRATAILGKSAGVFIRMAPMLIPIEVTSTPTSAQVIVDGRSVGRTPAKFGKVGFNEVKITVVQPGYLAWTQTVTPEPPSVAVHADLSKKQK